MCVCVRTCVLMGPCGLHVGVFALVSSTQTVQAFVPLNHPRIGRNRRGAARNGAGRLRGRQRGRTVGTRRWFSLGDGSVCSGSTSVPCRGWSGRLCPGDLT